MSKYWKHFKTITIHKWYVMKACFKAGLFIQGILHDLSKYSITEFWRSARYFQGDKSPIDAEKIANGYSLAWQNHKAKNKHHWQYWTDFESGQMILLPMPPKYLAEMICDWVGAGKAYNKGKWTIELYKSWYKSHRDTMHIHNSSKAYLDMIAKWALNESDIYKIANPKRIQSNYIQDMCEGCFYQPKLNAICNESGYRNPTDFYTKEQPWNPPSIST